MILLLKKKVHSILGLNCVPGKSCTPAEQQQIEEYRQDFEATLKRVVPQKKQQPTSVFATACYQVG